MADGYNFDKKTSLGETMNSLLNRQDALIRERQKEGKLGTMEKVMGLLGILSIVDGVATKNSSIKTKNMLDSPELIKTQAKTDFLKAAPSSQLIVDYGKYYNPNDKTGSIKDISKQYIANADKTIFSGTGYDPAKDSFEDLTDKSQETIYTAVQPTASSIYTIIENQGGEPLLEPYTAGRIERQREFVNAREGQNNFIDRFTNWITGNKDLFSDKQAAQDFLKGKLIYNEDESALVDNPDWVEGGIEYPGTKFVKLDRIGALPDFTGKQFSFKPKQKLTSSRIVESASFNENGELVGYEQTLDRVVTTDERGNIIEAKWVPSGEPVPTDAATQKADETLREISLEYPSSSFLLENRKNITLNQAIDELTRNERPYSEAAYTNLKQFDDEIQQLYKLKTNAQRLSNLFPSDSDIPRIEYIDPELINALGGDLESYTRANLETFKRFEYQKAWKEGRLRDNVKGLNDSIKESYGLAKNDNNQPIIVKAKDVTLVKPSLTRVKTLGDGTPIVVDGKEQLEAVMMPDQLTAFNDIGQEDSHIVDAYFRKVTGQAPTAGDVFPANHEELNITPWVWNNELKEWNKF